MVWLLHDKTGIHHPSSEITICRRLVARWTSVPANSQQFHLDPSPAEGDGGRGGKLVKSFSFSPLTPSPTPFKKGDGEGDGA